MCIRDRDNDDLDVLLKTTDSATMSLEQSTKFFNTKRRINGICKALSLSLIHIYIVVCYHRYGCEDMGK